MCWLQLLTEVVREQKSKLDAEHRLMRVSELLHLGESVRFVCQELQQDNTEAAAQLMQQQAAAQQLGAVQSELQAITLKFAGHEADMQYVKNE